MVTRLHDVSSTRRILLPILNGAILATAIGCASPGIPRPPSLEIPVLVTGLTAERVSGTVTLTVPVPERSTDRLPLRAGTYRGVLCRALETGPCLTIASFAAYVTASPTSTAKPGSRMPSGVKLTLVDALPPDLASGTFRLLAYRVELFSPAGATAGRSDPAFAAAGTPPPQVADLRGAGSRAGAILTWTPLPSPPVAPAIGDVIISRRDLVPPTTAKAHRPDTLFFSSNSAAQHPGVTLDSSLTPGTPYRYRAVRISRITLAGHLLELRSEPSAPVDLTLSQTYPPAAPSGLTAAASADPGPPAIFAIDLIWQPVDDPGPTTHTAAPLAGYLVYREALSGTPSAKGRLTAAPLPSSAFHDMTALPTQRYRYAVTAIDTAGNESPAATVTVDPQP